MPIVHKYRGKQGYYIKTRQGNRMVTYQLTEAAVRRLGSAGVGDGDRIDPGTLHHLVVNGSAYTHKSGPGIILGRTAAVPIFQFLAPIPARHIHYNLADDQSWVESTDEVADEKSWVAYTLSECLSLREPFAAPVDDDLSRRALLCARPIEQIPIHWATHLWRIIVTEVVGIPVWLWLIIGIGILMPSYLLILSICKV